MRAGQGSVPNVAGCFGDRRREPVALREAAVVLQERLDAVQGFIFHADADCGPLAVVTVHQERLLDRVTNTHGIR